MRHVVLGILQVMSSNDWPEHQAQLRRDRQASETVNRALLLIGEKHEVDRSTAFKLLAAAAQAQHRVVSALAADVLRTGELPDV